MSSKSLQLVSKVKLLFFTNVREAVPRVLGGDLFCHTWITVNRSGKCIVSVHEVNIETCTLTAIVVFVDRLGFGKSVDHFD